MDLVPLAGDATAVYRNYDAADSLLYIGISDHFGRRWEQHAKVQPWWPHVRRQTVTWYATRAEALAEEATAIHEERPAFNVTHNAMPGMSVAELLALPISIDVATAGRAFGIGYGRARELARSGEFPCRVLRIGNRYRVPRSALLDALGFDPAAASEPNPAA